LPDVGQSAAAMAGRGSTERAGGGNAGASEGQNKEVEQMLYRQTNGSANGGPRCLSGASISQLIRRMSPAERAILGAELVEGRIVLEPPTAKTVGALAGERPLIEPRRCAPAPMDWGALVEELRLIGVEKTVEAERAA
jgi:hypothetical protein